jgi:pentatricopeptide repeat protein
MQTLVTNSVLDTLIGFFAKSNNICKIHDVLAQHTKIANEKLHDYAMQLFLNANLSKDADRVYTLMLNRGFMPSDITITRMMSAHCKAKNIKRAFELFQALIQKRRPISVITYTIILLACINNKEFTLGHQIYYDLARNKITLDKQLASTAIKLFTETNNMIEAEKIFRNNNVHDIVTYNILISGYTKTCDYESGLQLYSQLMETGLKPDLELCNTMIKLYCESGNMEKAIELFTSMRYTPSQVTYNILVAGTTPRDTKELEEIHEKFKSSNLSLTPELCSSLIAAYFRQDNYAKGFEVYRTAISQNVPISLNTYAKLLGSFASLQFSYELESTLKNAQNTFQKCVLMLCYGFRSEYNRAKEIFDSIKNKDVDVWNCYLRILTRGGNGQASLTALEKMISDGVEPDNLSYNQIVSACGHRFMVKEAEELYGRLQKEYKISSVTTNCMIDVYARTGNMEKAEQLARTVKRSPHRAWTAVLAGCKLYNDHERGKRILKYISHLPASHTLMANIYASMGKWDEHAEIKTFMNTNRISKIPGLSIVLIKGREHRFKVEDKQVNPEMIAYLKRVREQISKKYGYVPDESCILKEIPTLEAKVDHLWQHAEKLALSLAILETTGNILITKNLRMCKDCHEAIKWIADLEKRKIVVVDNSRAHVFENGTCDCGGRY